MTLWNAGVSPSCGDETKSHATEFHYKTFCIFPVSGSVIHQLVDNSKLEVHQNREGISISNLQVKEGGKLGEICYENATTSYIRDVWLVTMWWRKNGFSQRSWGIGVEVGISCFLFSFNRLLFLLSSGTIYTSNYWLKDNSGLLIHSRSKYWLMSVIYRHFRFLSFVFSMPYFI